METDNTNHWGIIAIILLILALVIAQFTVNQEIIRLQQKIDSFSSPMQMIGSDYQVKNATGVYIPSCGYFVDTRNRDNLSEIQMTEAHEQVHMMIMEDMRCGDIGCYEHFCGG